MKIVNRRAPEWILMVCFALLCSIGTAKAGETNLTLTGVGNIVDSGAYVGPYTAQVTGGSTIQIICDNYNTQVHVGLNWNASMNTFSDSDFVDDVKFSDTSTNPNVGRSGTAPSAATVLLDYEGAAWLAQKIMADYNAITSKNRSAMTQQIGDLSYALLAIFSSSAKSSQGFDHNASVYYWDALHPTVAYNISQFSDVVFWTPDPLGASQEYIMITPEPFTLLLFGTGLLAIAGMLRRKRLNQ